MLPIGLQDFATLRSGGYIYVDKTQHIYGLIRAAKYQFLSRPRRFGKSLLVSTLKAIFEGQKNLFEGLWIEDQHDFLTHPVVHIDFNRIEHREADLAQSIVQRLKLIAQEHGLKLGTTDPRSALDELVTRLATNQRVVILVDEYDKPITDVLDQPERRSRNQEILKSLYGAIKSLDAYLHLVLLTGVSKFGKLSLFSDLNNLADFSLNPRFASMLGYTQAELERYFEPYLEEASRVLGLPMTDLLQSLRFWYNGYSWDGQSRLYCPFSILRFLDNPVFKGYWYETGTPSFLLKLVREQKINPLELEQQEAVDRLIGASSIDQLDAISLMFQTGYLTIHKQEPSPGGVIYTLTYPNEEVRQAFSTQLIAEYAGYLPHQVASLGIALYRALHKQDWDAFFMRVNQTFASVPYQVFKAQESYFHSLMHLMLVSTGYPVRSEESTSKGRMDSVLEMPERVCVFEFKLDGAAEQAIQQIKDEGYAQKFAKEVKLIGVVFDREKRQVGEWAVE